MQPDVVVIGAGPTGLACGIELKRRGIQAVLLDKGCLCNSLYNYPTQMTFFTTPELLEIGDLSFELEAHTGVARLLLQDPQQGVTAHPAKAVSGRFDDVTAVVDRDIVPMN